MKKRFSIPLWIVGLLVVLVLARIALPFVVRDQINSRIADMGNYSGHVADVDIALWRGAYELHGLVVRKVSDEVEIPLFVGPEIDISLAWRHLFRGRIVGELVFISPELNFVDGRDETDTQTGEDTDWREALNNIVPFEINELIVRDGTIRFNNPHSQPPIDAAIESVQARVVNLSNVQDIDDLDTSIDRSGSDPEAGREARDEARTGVDSGADEGERAERARRGRFASIEAEGLLLGESPVELHATLDPFGRLDDFQFHLRVVEVDLTALNDFAREYASLDFESGHGEFVMELEARDGQLDGHATPLFHDMQIFSWQSDVQEDDKNPLQIAWEATAELLTSVFQNQPEDQFATRVPIQGTIDDEDIGVLRAVLNVLRNAFVEAYRADFERLDPRPSD